jgi:pimeloyl-ACP methyl ester carboxylesterase
VPDPSFERVEYDEFGLFHENAEEFGLPFDGPPIVRREFVEVEPGRSLSALVWGTGDPELVLLHGGAQNGHTWDTVALALGRPLVAIDLPGHGHSDRGRDGSLAVQQNAGDVAAAIRSLAPHARGVAGMSLGGATTLALAHVAPEVVRAVVLVDITPGVTGEKAKAITSFVAGPASFASFDELLERTVQFNPTRSVASLRRGILHNAVQRDDGTWVWRYARWRELDAPAGGSDTPPEPDAPKGPDFAPLWDVVSSLAVPLMLVRGMRVGSVVDDEDEAELLRRAPGARVEHVDAGHSVQGDAPLELARLLDDFLP